MCLDFLLSLLIISNTIMGTCHKPLGSITSVNLELANNSIRTKDSEADKLLGCNTTKVSDKISVILSSGNLFLTDTNRTYNLSEYRKIGGAIYICNDDSPKNAFLTCKKWIFKESEYHKFPNGSVLITDQLLEPGEYEFKEQDLLTCVPDDDPDYTNYVELPPSEENTASIYVGQIGCSISIFALLFHLITFCMIPSLRNLPGYNLASLSVAFFFGYLFLLIGQIPKVLGVYCKISAALEQYFFLAAFFCMNVMAFDVWKSLKLATEKLIMSSQNAPKRQFVRYSIYAWGFPLLITTTSVVIDNIDGIPDILKPQIGLDKTCWMANHVAKALFFAVPAFTLFIINGFFFLRSAYIIKSNVMKCPSEQQKQSMKTNYILYLRLALIMGVTWLFGMIAIAAQNDIMWFINDFLNSFQGLFVFLLFSCSKKVFKHLKEKVSNVSEKMSSEKHCTSSTKEVSQST